MSETIPSRRPPPPLDAVSEHVDSHHAAAFAEAPRYPALEGEHRVDVAIVGGGLSGAATALGLAERGVSVALVEARRIGWGASGRNGGQLTGSLSGDVAMQRQLTRHVGRDEAVRFVRDLRWRGHAIVRERVARHAIDCELQAGHLHTAWSPSHVKGLQAALADARLAGLDESEARWLTREDVHARLETPLYHGGVLNLRNLHLNPLKLCAGEARAAAGLGALVFEGSEVLDIESDSRGTGARVTTAAGSVRADAVVLAGNAHHRLERRSLAGLVLPAILGNLVTERLDAATLEALNPERLAVYDSRVVLDYYRPTADGRLLFGGGTNYSGHDIADVAGALRPALERTFPRLAGVGIERAWTGTAAIVANRIPIVRRLRSGVFVAQGYSGHGIATSHVASEVLADALTGDTSRLETFERFRHWRLPMGNLAMALGMGWYRLLEAGRDRLESRGQAGRTTRSA